MAEDKAGAAAPTATKTRRSGVNKVDILIESAGDAGKYLEAFREKVGGEDNATRTYNNSGFTSLAFDDIEPDGLLKMITCASDALGRKDASKMQIAAQITASTSRRQIEAQITEDYKKLATRASFKNLDDFARKQTNGKTGKHFTSFLELIAVAVDAEMSGDAAKQPAGTA